MSRIITIKPKPNSKRFFSTANQFQKRKGADGVETDVNAGAYKGERFPNSRQMFRPKYSMSKRRWLLAGFDDNHEDLNKLVLKCKLKYPKKHPKFGEFIKEADVFDYNDPFFCHKLLKVISKEGEVSLDKNRALDNIILRGCKADPQFQVGLGNGGPISSRVKYIISDKEREVSMRKKVRSSKMKAYKLLDAMDFEKKKKVAMVMGLIVDDSIDPDLLTDSIFNAIDGGGKIGTKTKQEVFIEMSEVDSEVLDFKHQVFLAKRKGLLRKRKNGYELFGSYAGKEMRDVEAYLQNEDNQSAWMRLQQVLAEK